MMSTIPSPASPSWLEDETPGYYLFRLFEGQSNASSDEGDHQGDMSDETDGETGPPAPSRLQYHASEFPTLHRRNLAPSHYLLKIESFPSLSKASVENYRSEFEAGGYKWELSIYPTGDKKNGGQDHISVFLRLLDTNHLPLGWEVNAIFTFFVFDQRLDEYVTPQGEKVIKRFHSMKTKWGIPKFIDLETFQDPSNGYLLNGSCTFGAEVFVIKSTFRGECLSAIDEPVTCTHTWKIASFSSLTLKTDSDWFVGGDYKWRIALYANGDGEGMWNSISLYLELDNSTLPPNTKLFVNYVLRVKQQTSGKHFEKKDSSLFSSSSAGWGFRQFMSLAKFKHPDNGYLVGDTCIIEAQFEVVGLVKRE